MKILILQFILIFPMMDGGLLASDTFLEQLEKKLQKKAPFFKKLTGDAKKPPLEGVLKEPTPLDGSKKEPPKAPLKLPIVHLLPHKAEPIKLAVAVPTMPPPSPPKKNVVALETPILPSFTAMSLGDSPLDKALSKKPGALHLYINATPPADERENALMVVDLMSALEGDFKANILDEATYKHQGEAAFELITVVIAGGLPIDFYQMASDMLEGKPPQIILRDHESAHKIAPSISLLLEDSAAKIYHKGQEIPMLLKIFYDLLKPGGTLVVRSLSVDLQRADLFAHFTKFLYKDGSPDIDPLVYLLVDRPIFFRDKTPNASVSLKTGNLICSAQLIQDKYVEGTSVLPCKNLKAVQSLYQPLLRKAGFKQWNLDFKQDSNNQNVHTLELKATR